MAGRVTLLAMKTLISPSTVFTASDMLDSSASDKVPILRLLGQDVRLWQLDHCRRAPMVK